MNNSDAAEISGPKMQDATKALGVQAYAVLPMIAGSAAIATLYLNLMTQYPFTSELQNTLQLFANQAAVAISNARLHATLRGLVIAGQTLAQASPDIDATLQTIADSAKETIKCDMATVLPFDERTREFEIEKAKASGVPEGVKFRTRRPRKDGVTSRVLKDGILVVEDRDDRVRYPFIKQDPVSFTQEARVRAFIGIRLRRGKEDVGVLHFNYHLPRKFADEELEAAQLLGNQAAIAIKNARLFAETQHRLNQLNALQEALSDLVQELDPKRLMPIVIKKAASLIADGDETGIGAAYWRCDHDKKKIINEYSRNPKFEGTEFDFETGLVGKVSSTGKAECVNDYRNWPGRARNLDKEGVIEKLQNLIAVPVKKGDTVIAVLVVSSDANRNRLFHDNDIELLESFAGLALIAIQNARLYEQKNAVSEVGQQLTASIRLSEAEILSLLHKQASRVMDTRNMYIALYDESTDTVRFPLAYLNGKPVDTSTEKGWQPRSGGRGRTEWIVRTRQPLLDRTLAESKAWYDAPGRKEYISQAFTSWVGVPMIVSDHVLGVIATYHPDRDNVYGEDDVQVLSMMAGYAAIALDNARLVQDLEGVVKELDGRVNELNNLRELSEELSTGVWLGEG